MIDKFPSICPKVVGVRCSEQLINKKSDSVNGNLTKTPQIHWRYNLDEEYGYYQRVNNEL